jgi:hypothetical protein
MTELLHDVCSSTIAVYCLTNLSSRPERTWISYLAELSTTTDAALRKESRTNFINATELDRNPGERSGEICSSLLQAETHLLAAPTTARIIPSLLLKMYSSPSPSMQKRISARPPEITALPGRPSPVPPRA